MIQTAARVAWATSGRNSTHTARHKMARRINVYKIVNIN